MIVGDAVGAAGGFFEQSIITVSSGTAVCSLRSSFALVGATPEWDVDDAESSGFDSVTLFEIGLIEALLQVVEAPVLAVEVERDRTGALDRYCRIARHQFSR